MDHSCTGMSGPPAHLPSRSPSLEQSSSRSCSPCRATCHISANDGSLSEPPGELDDPFEPPSSPSPRDRPRHPPAEDTTRRGRQETPKKPSRWPSLDFSSPAGSFSSQAGPARRPPFESPFKSSPPSVRDRVMPHPYARFYAYREWEAAAKPRRIWSHALEGAIFTREELLMVRAGQRRKVYIASLEAHIDALHAQLIEYGLYPVPFADLAPYKGMSSKIVKGVLVGLQTDAQFIRSKQTEIERANLNLRNTLNASVPRYDSDDVPDFRTSSPRSATLLPPPPVNAVDRARSVPTP